MINREIFLEYSEIFCELRFALDIINPSLSIYSLSFSVGKKSRFYLNLIPIEIYLKMKR